MAKAKTKKISKEEAEKRNSDFRMQEMIRKLDYMNEPTYSFEIGDSVVIGNLKDVVISEKYFDGKFYEATYTSIDNNYGNPIETPNCKNLFEWFYIRKPNNTEDSFIVGDSYTTHRYQSSLESVMQVHYSFGLDMDVPYQRGYVWTEEDQVNLIHSIFNNINIGSVTLARRKFKEGEKSYEVIDGKQRIKTFLDFYEDRFKYKGRIFSELSNKDRYHFKEYGIMYYQLTEPTQAQILECFIKMNTAGRVMSKEDISKAVNMLLTRKEQ